MEVAVLDALHASGATAQSAYRRTSTVLDSLAERTEILPHPGYRVVCDLSRAWAVHLRLVDFHGNSGTPDFGPTEARYSECRLTTLGAAAVLAEQGRIGALPIGMINGSVYLGGRRPPLDPDRTVAALRAAVAGAADDEIVQTLGPPAFPTGCAVGGDLEGLARGEPIELALTASIGVEADDRLVITNLPPDVGASYVARDLMTGRVADIDEVADETVGLDGTARIVVHLRSGAEPTVVVAALRQRWGIRSTVDVGFGEPVPSILRNWLSVHGDAALEMRLGAIESAIEAEHTRRSADVRPLGRASRYGYRPL